MQTQLSTEANNNYYYLFGFCVPVCSIALMSLDDLSVNRVPLLAGWLGGCY